jgi:DNA-binding NarL/FixJ family response regulator
MHEAGRNDGARVRHLPNGYARRTSLTGCSARMHDPCMSTAGPEPRDAPPAGGATGPLRILVVDADDRTRESVVGILGIRHRFEVVGSAAHVGAAIELVKRERPDVVILDPRLPEVSGGMTLIRRIRAIDPDIAILAVGWSPDLEHQALAAGADGFVRKTFKPGDLAGAIGRCMDSRVTEAASDLLEADARIASLKGEPGLVAVDPHPATPSGASSVAAPPERLAPRGAGAIL